MNNLELLKNELIEQKNAIEEKGGLVQVLNLHPSPTEITAGIKSIPSSNSSGECPNIDLSIATASEEDVLEGKTFYAVDTKLKTGTLVTLAPKDLETIFYSADPIGSDVDESTYTYNITLPDVLTIRPYVFYSTIAKLNVTLPDGIKIIGARAFDQSGAYMTNFNELKQLIRVNEYGLATTKNIDLANIPTCLTHLEMGAFYDVISTSNKIKLNNSFINIGSSSFAYSEHTTCDSVDISELRTGSIPIYFCKNLAVNSNLEFPINITGTSDHIGYNGSFHNVIFHEKFKSLATYTFTGSNSAPNEYFAIKSFVFMNETPPTVGSNSFHMKHFNNGAKIYVPDNAVEAYKTTRVMSTFASYIHPMSERP